jgi:glutamine phosphoribosylpyrophosphate amidotransferase
MRQSEAGYRYSEASSNPEAQGLIKNQLIQKVYVKGRERRSDEVRAKVVAVSFLWCIRCFKL